MAYGADSRKYPYHFRTWYEAVKHISVGLLNAINDRGHLEVEVASQITPPFMGHFYHMNNGWTTSTADMVVGEHDIVCTSVAAASIGDSVIVSDTTNKRYFYAHVLSVNGLTVTVDAEIDFPYASGSDVAFASHDMNVDGSVDHKYFGIRQAENPDNLQTEIKIDITRVIHSMITTSLGDLDDFGDISGGLANGLLLRKKLTDGTYQNIVNIRNNADYVLNAFDFDRYVATNPGQGVNGQKWRMTFGGEEKMGTVIRLGPGEDLEWVVQDDLSSLLSFQNIAQGSLVNDSAGIGITQPVGTDYFVTWQAPT